MTDTFAVKQKAEEFVRNTQAPGTSVLVAVSGGSDSVGALLFFSEYGSQLGIQSLAVAHIDHNLRPDSKSDAQFVFRLARDLNLPCYSASAYPSPETIKSQGTESWARKVRYQLLKDIREQHAPQSCIVTAHTRDDQVETLFLRIGRGTGLRGLQCIKALREDNIWRPFLTWTRKELRDYLLSRGGKWKEDPTNLDLQFRRNWIRHKVLPQVSGGNPERIADSCAKIARLAQHVWPVAAADALREFSRSVLWQTGADVSADLPVWLGLPWMQCHVGAVFSGSEWATISEESGQDFLLLGFQMFLEEAQIDLVAGAHKELEKVLQQGHRAVIVSADWTLERSGARLFLIRRYGRFPEIQCREAQNIAYSQPFSVRVCRKSVRWDSNNYLLAVEMSAEASKAMSAATTEFCTLLLTDAELSGTGRTWCEQIRVRFRESGDVFSPAGIQSRTRKLNKYLAEAGMPESLRNLLPLVAINKRIVWIPGVNASSLQPQGEKIRINMGWKCLNKNQ